MNNSPANIKFSKPQLSKMVQPGRFVDKLTGTSLRADLSLMKNLLQPLAEIILTLLGLAKAASVADAAN